MTKTPLLMLLAALAATGQQRRAIPDLPYRMVEEWPRQALSAAGTPAGPWNFIQVPGVAIDSESHVVVLHRGAHPVLEFNADGSFRRSWGDGLFSFGKVTYIAAADRKPGGSGYSAVYGPAGCDSCGAHAVRTDPQGNLWLVDAPGQVVYKTDGKTGRILMTLGRKGVAGTGPGEFNLPTDIAFAPNGDLYVSDGYGGARVVKFTAQGKFLLEFGRRGTGPSQFGLPHNVAVDQRGRVYVLDRDNHRVQVFDAAGKYLSEWPSDGTTGLYLTREQKIWAGATLHELDGKPIGKLPGGDNGAHGIAVGPAGEVYLGLLTGKMQKFVPAR